MSIPKPRYDLFSPLLLSLLHDSILAIEMALNSNITWPPKRQVFQFTIVDEYSHRCTTLDGKRRLRSSDTINRPNELFIVYGRAYIMRYEVASLPRCNTVRQVNGATSASVHSVR